MRFPPCVGIACWISMFNGSTAKMLAQAGISLRRDVDQQSVGGGFWTTATAFNERFYERLQAHAGLTFDVLKTTVIERSKA